MPEPATAQSVRRSIRPGALHDRVAIRRQRYAAGLSVTDLARMAGIAKSHLSEIENGTRAPSPKVLKRIAVALDVKTESIMLPRKAA